MSILENYNKNFGTTGQLENTNPDTFPEMMIGFAMKETTFRKINELLDNCRALSLEGYLGDVDQARGNLKNILNDVQKVRKLIDESSLIGKK